MTIIAHGYKIRNRERRYGTEFSFFVSYKHYATEGNSSKQEGKIEYINIIFRGEKRSFHRTKLKYNPLHHRTTKKAISPLSAVGQSLAGALYVIVALVTM
mmetsp:Transcript_9736/g.14197  ORF Transcript_9736/g.14197 Transcript_9736/m.14197 type:complete len:100 (-) Transcript_9736:387-686(-)